MRDRASHLVRPGRNVPVDGGTAVAPEQFVVVAICADEASPLTGLPAAASVVVLDQTLVTPTVRESARAGEFEHALVNNCDGLDRVPAYG